MTDALSLGLTSEQVNTFWQQGFLSLDRITTDREIAYLQEIYDRIIEQITLYSPAKIAELAANEQLPLAGGKEILVWIASPELFFPELLDTDYFRNALKMAANLFKVTETRVTGKVRMYYKPAQYGAEMPWHQDVATHGSADFLKIWMPLDPATIKNGCLQFIPGSHLAGRLPHRPCHEQDPTGGGLTVNGVDPLQAVICPLKPGGATIHHCQTLHYSNANKTDQQRRAFVISCRVG
jgi:ectoine hydroxylase-related dioxygenase (phytanoyl-CoA dioxygenase family)